MARPKGIPGYLHHKASDRAFVRLNGTDIYLGFYGTKESKDEYNRVISDWLSNNRRLPVASAHSQEEITVNGICLAFLTHANTYYRKEGRLTSEYNEYEVVSRILNDQCGVLPAVEFTRRVLKTIRELMIPLKWKRSTVNARIKKIKHVFKWAAQEDMLPASVYQELQLLEGLKKGRSACPESEPVAPVPLEDYEKTLKFCPPIIADMARIQYLAAMRPGEICALRMCDLDRSGDIWMFDFHEHKTSHHGHDRTVMFGHRVQAILTPYLMEVDGEPERFLFSPRDTVRLAKLEKRRNRKSKVQPSQICRAKKNPQVRPTERYDTDTYRRVLQRAADCAGVERWSPNQLRHTRATEIRRKYGLEAAQIILGHENAKVTEIYAERDKQKGIDIMREIG